MENYKPLVSVIINCYNGEKYLREAIDSVIAQTYTNWELIFWDNQSTDSTADIVKSYNDERIHYYYAPEHTPLGEARNLAMEKANGEYIGFLDSDDIWLKYLLSKYISAIIKNNYPDLVYSNYYCRNADTTWLISKTTDNTMIDHKEFVRKYNIAISSALFRFDKQNGIKSNFDSRFSLIEDYDFFLKLSLSNSILYIGEPLIIYRYHENNLSKQRKWGGEFAELYGNILYGKGVYNEMSVYKDIVRNRMYYVLANESINDGKKMKALLYMLKLPFMSFLFCRMLMKIITPTNIIHFFEKKKYM